MIDISWTPDKSSEIAIYKQIITFVKSQIRSGYWTKGMKLPSQRELALLLGVNRSTVTQAYEFLAADGIIEGNSKGGTVIKNTSWSLYLSSNQNNWNYYMDYGIHKPNKDLIQVINKEEFREDVIRLSTGEPSPSLYPKELLEEVFKRSFDHITSLNYLEGKGLYRLRFVLSRYLNKQGIKATPETLLITSGALQSLQLISLGITPKGSNILVESPSYLHSLRVFQSAGMELVGLKMDQGGLMPSEIIRYKNRTSNFLYTIPTFHNPTGITMSETRRREIVEACERENLPIIEDDVYRELWLDELPPQPLKTLDQGGNILYLGSLSKSLAPGLRIGWMVGPEPIIERLADIKMQTDYGSSTLSQIIAADCIESGSYERHLDLFRIELKKRRDHLDHLLGTYFGDIASWSVPKGGFYIWLKFKRPIDHKKLFYACLKNKLLINPGSIYEHTDTNALRLSYSYASLEELEWAIPRLRALIDEQKN